MLAAWLLVTLAITAWKWDVIDSPPYYDFATGLFVEATFLAESNFDYHSLVFEQERWLAGGPAVYITSILPTFLAVLMKTLPTPAAVFVTYHVFTFACTALVLVLMYGLLRDQTGRAGAMLTCLALVTVPIFSVQVDMLGMEMPLAVCGMACAGCLARRRFVWAATFGGLSLLAKNTGLVLTAGVVVFVVLVLFLGWRGLQPRSKRWYWFGASAVFFVVGVFMLIDELVLALPSSELESWDNFRHDVTSGIVYQTKVLTWCPDQAVVFLIAAVGSVVVASRWIARQWPKRHGSSGYDQLTNLLHDGIFVQPVAVFGWIIVLGMLTAFLMIYSIPRYFVLPLPFLYINLGLLLFHNPRLRRASYVGLVCLIAFHLLNASGRFLPDFDSTGRTGANLERSREYLRDHRSNIEAMRMLGQMDPPLPVIAGSPYVHYLGLPSLGCVERPLPGYSVNTFVPPSFQSATKLVEEAPLDVVFVSVDSALIPPGLIPPPTLEQDEVLYNDQQEHPLIVYYRRWPRHIRRADIAGWYRAMLRPQQSLTDRASSLVQDQRYDEALVLYKQALEEDPADADARVGIGHILSMRGQQAEALEYLDRGIELTPDHLGMRYLRGALNFELGRHDKALVDLDESIRIDADHAPSHHVKGLALANLGQWSEAANSLGEATRLDPLNADYQRDWGRLLILAGDPQAAIERLRRALQLRPHWIPAANDLAWLLATHPDDAVRDGAEAVRLAERNQSQSDLPAESVPGLLDTLAAAYAEAGRFDEATATAEKAAAEARKLGQNELAETIDEHARLFEAGKPYREAALP